jgi:diketogulonate reductase-like aldo/keto reductase
MQSMTIPSLTLNTGHEIPQLGFGVFQIPPEETEAAVAAALAAGHRHIDTAAAYGNEAEVGAALAASDVPREDVFVTTKVWSTEQGRDRTLRSFEQSMARLRLDQVDLFLIHWPAPQRGLYEETWLTLVDLYREGRVRSIGVSNFLIEHLDRLAEVSDVVPAANQIEVHPYLQQQELRRVNRERGIVTEAWSPMAQGEVVRDPVLIEIAEREGSEAALAALAWSLQEGNVVLTKSVTPERIRGNLDALKLRLTDEDMEAIAGLDRGERVGPDPMRFG